MNRFWEWFQADDKQKKEISSLVQSIIQVKFLTTMAELTKSQDGLPEKIKSLNKNNEETSRLIIALFADLERNYYELIIEIIGQLNIDELTNLQKFLEEG